MIDNSANEPQLQDPTRIALLTNFVNATAYNKTRRLDLEQLQGNQSCACTKTYLALLLMALPVKPIC